MGSDLLTFFGNLFNRDKTPPAGKSSIIQELLSMGSGSASGVSVTPETAMRQATVFACVRVLSESLAQLPKQLYQHRRDGGKDRLTETPLYTILHHQPNEWMTSFELFEYAMASVANRGNFYSFINWIGRGDNQEIKELLPLPTGDVEPVMDDNWNLSYKVRLNGQQKTIPAGNIWHVRGMTVDGFTGLSLISYQREVIGMAIAAERHGASMFKNGARPGGVLKHPQKLSPDAAARISESWAKAHGGGKQGGTAVLEEGLDYQAITITNKDAQYLEARKFQRNEIAAIYRVPPHLIGDLEKATFSNIEHQSLEFVKFTMLPWCKRFEQTIYRDLLTPAQRAAGVFAEFNLDGLERGDLAGRYAAYNTGINAGILCPNECRAKENLNPRPGGNEFLRPLNMEVSGKSAPRPFHIKGRQKSSVASRNEIRDRFAPRLKAGAQQFVGYEARQLLKAIKETFGAKSRVAFEEWLAAFYAGMPDRIKGEIGAMVKAYALAVGAAALTDTDQTTAPDLDKFMAEYLDTYTARYVSASQNQLAAIIRDTDPAEIEAALTQRVTEWEQTRAEKTANDEAVRVGAAVARLAWAAAGVTSLVWVTQGAETCPFCHQLEGKKVGILDPFIGPGQTLNASDGSGLKIHGTKRHPPIHQGCVCTILPG